MPSDSVLISALQKFIRRGEVPGALYAAQQLLFPFSFQRWDRLWRRLIIIGAEDIGLAQSGVFLYLHRRKELIEAELAMGKEREKRVIEIVLKAVWTLTLARKSRLTDHAFIYLDLTLKRGEWTLPKEFSLWEILAEPEIEEDELLKGIVQGETLPYTDSWRAFFSSEIPAEISGELSWIYKEWLKNKCVLFTVHAGLLLVRKKLGPVIKEQVAELPEIFPIELPDFVYDQHTAEGRKLGRGLKHFLEEGCKLENRAEELEDPFYRELLELKKEIETK